MFFSLGEHVQLETKRMFLRPPTSPDYKQWVVQRQKSEDYLRKWEPQWFPNHLTSGAFKERVSWARRLIASKQGYPFFLFRRDDSALMGALTLDNVRRGASETGTIGYWIGAEFSSQGYMTEAVEAVIHFAFTKLDLSRIEAACLPENTASRRVLERSGFKYEGVAQSYLQINGRRRTHVLYANLRPDRRGTTDAG